MYIYTRNSAPFGRGFLALRFAPWCFRVKWSISVGAAIAERAISSNPQAKNIYCISYHFIYIKSSDCQESISINILQKLAILF